VKGETKWWMPTIYDNKDLFIIRDLYKLPRKYCRHTIAFKVLKSWVESPYLLSITT